jgi:hypothetical protein
MPDGESARSRTRPIEARRPQKSPDTISTQSAGWQAGLILRRGNAHLDVGRQPDYIGQNLNEIADQIGRHRSDSGQ